MDAILRAGISKFSEDVGKLWTCLANYYIRLAHFEKARDIFEEGIEKVVTIKDFSMLWDSYIKFEDQILVAQMELVESGEGFILF